jgi:HPt (histidine-containing phosphotransfer) domain-containing protein
MDGLEASRRIREWENGNFHTYIVGLTASYLPEQGHLLFEAGIDNYIEKPYDVEHIRHLLSVIARSDQSTQVQASLSAGRKDKDGVLDTETGIQRVGGDLNSYRELLNDFVQGLPNRINTLEQLFNQQDMTTLAREAHNLKGVSSNLGAWELSGYASKLDKQSVEGYTDQNRTLLVDLKRAENNLYKTAIDFLDKKR